MQQPIFQHSAHGLKNPGRDDKGEKVTKIQLSHYCFDCKKKLKSAVLQFTKCKILYMPLLAFAQKQVFTPDIRGDDHNTTI